MKHSIEPWQHKHRFSNINTSGERNTRYVLYLTLITMVAEIVAGIVYGSMALLADGWHMGTHAAAFMITLFTYRYAKKYADDPKYAFGTGKVSVLGGFTSAIALGLVALLMVVESISRLLNPEHIQFNEAILVAVIGLTVNVVSVFLLKDHHSHDHHGHHHHGNGHHAHSHNPHSHEHHHAHEGADHHAHQSSLGHDSDSQAKPTHDHNLRAAYFHVLADALTSLLAIGALLFGKYLGLNWLDPVMGIVGAIIITSWAWGLVKQTGPILLDASIDDEYISKMVATVEEEEDHQVTDIHVWPVSADHHAAMISIVSHHPKDTDYFRAKLSAFKRIDHLTVEVFTCRQQECGVNQSQAIEK
ncbi:CDF family Co(II)/Ni(II) efflux transporter DmeF [Shewanella psychrotolerans]|uniref:CDF family Co(II)/Ni(II) efflux transporter DmeF n=1 Tax=Shewanella psychrotolerans TaxID=2864206 RepID=UPI001C65A26A|nr:CDF family Co(II)/Ni(II) efflux transporter DmeF [Shewanella psychrotolerans]QYJ99894.1 CDF family Co(II)/Ni(II) efflux transporter DmeF [Shewanella psychrotolerans]